MTRTPTKKKFGVCLVSAHPLFLTQFQEKLASSGFQLQASKLTAADGVKGLPAADVYVLDSFTHPRVTEDAVAGILANSPDIAVIVMAESFSEEVAFPLLHLGVKGILQYSDAEQQLPRALQAVCSGGYWVPRAILGRMLDHILGSDRRNQRGLRVHASVSPREKEILSALLENLSNKEIASKLNISERTVKFHVSNLLSKYGVQRRADLILLAYQTDQVVASRIQ